MLLVTWLDLINVLLKIVVIPEQLVPDVHLLGFSSLPEHQVLVSTHKALLRRVFLPHFSADPQVLQDLVVVSGIPNVILQLSSLALFSA